MQPALWLPHEPIRSREAPLPATLLSVSPTLDLKQMIAVPGCLLLFLCSVGGFVSETRAAVAVGSASEGSSDSQGTMCADDCYCCQAENVLLCGDS